TEGNLSGRPQVRHRLLWPAASGRGTWYLGHPHVAGYRQPRRSADQRVGSRIGGRHDPGDGGRALVQFETVLQGFSINTSEGGTAYCAVTLIRGQKLTLVDVGHLGRRALLMER